MITQYDNAHRSRRRFGFTSVESAVVVFIVSSLATLLLPAVRAARLSGNKTTFRVHASEYCSSASEFQSTFHRYPNDLTELGTEFGYFDSGRWIEQADGSVVVDGDLVRLQYAIDPVEVAMMLEMLLSIDEEAGEFVDGVMNNSDYPPGPLLLATTIRPLGPAYGDSMAYMDVSSCIRYFVFDVDSPAYQGDPLDTAALQSVAILLQSDPEPEKLAREVPSILRDPEAVQFVHAAFDQNFDGAITLGEFSQKSRELAEASTDENSTVGQQVTKQFFRVVVNELSLTVEDDGSEEIIFHIDGVQGDPAELFSYQKLCDHTSLYVVDEEIADRLCRRLQLAQFLEEKDLLQPRDNVLTAQQHRLDSLSGKAMLPEAAEELKILTEVRKGFGE